MKQTRFPSLEQALGYLHQDFPCDYPNADAAKEDFMKSEPPAIVAAARRELDDFIRLAERVPDPGELLLEKGCCYDPTADGMTEVEWLRKVEKMLSSAEE